MPSPTPHYRLHAISRRGRGRRRSATACVAYARGEGRYLDKADGVLATGRAGPDLGNWQQVDWAEWRRDACVARTLIVAVPHYLPLNEQIRVAQDHADHLRRIHGVAVLWSLHAPSEEGDDRNVHAHFVLTTRRVDDLGVIGPKAREMDQRTGGRAAVAALRGAWQDALNITLARNGRRERVDLRTLKAQGIDREPQRHLGPIVTRRVRRGYPSARHARNQLLQAQREAYEKLVETEAELVQARAELAAEDAHQRQAQEHERQRQRKVRRLHLVSGQALGLGDWLLETAHAPVAVAPVAAQPGPERRTTRRLQLVCRQAQNLSEALVHSTAWSVAGPAPGVGAQVAPPAAAAATHRRGRRAKVVADMAATVFPPLDYFFPPVQVAAGTAHAAADTDRRPARVRALVQLVHGSSLLAPTLLADAIRPQPAPTPGPPAHPGADAAAPLPAPAPDSPANLGVSDQPRRGGESPEDQRGAGRPEHRFPTDAGRARDGGDLPLGMGGPAPHGAHQLPAGRLHDRHAAVEQSPAAPGGAALAAGSDHPGGNLPSPSGQQRGAEAAAGAHAGGLGAAGAPANLPPEPGPLTGEPLGPPERNARDEMEARHKAAWAAHCRPLVEVAEAMREQEQEKTRKDEEALAYEALQAIQRRRAKPRDKPGNTILRQLEAMAAGMRREVLAEEWQEEAPSDDSLPG